MMLAVVILILRYALMLCLFAFLGWVALTLWRELRFQSQVVSARKIPAITLRMENGQEVVSQEFSKPEVLIGRGEDCDYIVDGEVVSNHHARLVFRSTQWWVEDLRSTNGTFLNDEHLDTGTVIIKGDELRIGHQIISIEMQTE